MTTATPFSRRIALLAAATLPLLVAIVSRPLHAADAPTTATAAVAAGVPGTTATQAVRSAAAPTSGGLAAHAATTTATAPAAPTIAVSIGPSTATLEAEKDLYGNTNEIRMNFRNAPIATVLSYLGRAGGFEIVYDTQPTGTVDVYSPRPLDQDGVIDLLNTVLAKKGYTAIRNDRILTIATRDAALKLDIPVIQGADPDKIPKSETIVTQILPVRHANAIRLLDNLKPLLSTTALVTANESSNAILLTDSQVNIRRMATIVKALDTSISDIAAIRVIILKYAVATSTADIINQLFQNSGSNSLLQGIQRAAAARNARGGAGGFPGAMGMPGGMPGMPGAFGGGNQSSNNATGETGVSAARDAATRILAVADDRMNAVIVSAPEEVLPTIEDTIRQLDVNTDTVTDVKVFFLRHADASDTANIITSTFSGTGVTGSVSSTQRGGTTQRTNTNMRVGAATSSSSNQSQRQTQANTVVAVADTRTNSVIVTAGADMMRQVEEIVTRLDADSAKNQEVRVIQLDSANSSDMATFLQALFPAPSSTGTSQNRTTTNRTTTNASSNSTNRTNSSNSNSSSNRTSSSGFGSSTGSTRFGN